MFLLYSFRGKNMRPVVAIIGLVLFLLTLFTQFESHEATGFVRVSDQFVLDGAGDPVVLKGFNVAFKDFTGPLGESDIKRIADSGASSIRLVIDYRQLESSPFEYDEKGFALLDTIVSWCEKYGVYLILDMHLAPGIQNPHDFVVHREKSYRFWEESQYQERFYALWTAIAKRYADSKIIAAYDLLNEGVAPDETQYLKVINTVAGKIRQYDKRHILIVEEALLPNHTKRILPIADNNVIYSIHFFYPPQFTFYTTTWQRPISKYPGEMSIRGEMISAMKSQAATGTGDWRRLTLRGAPPEGAEILQALVLSDEQHGRVWFDDVHLEVDGRPVDLPAPLVSNGSFEIDYPGISWEMRGPCGQVTDVTAKNGQHSIGFADCPGPAAVLSSPIAVDGGSYTLSAWVKTDNARGANRLALSWHKRKTLASFNKATLRDRLDYALRFQARHKAPVHVGEFTIHENPSTDSARNYLKDILDIMETEGLHWSYWTYYSEFPGIGIYTGNHAYLARPESLRILARYMRPPE
jgi:aryl-phospho-beta-D-glucosidase BglC (GH1 family)